MVAVLLNERGMVTGHVPNVTEEDTAEYQVPFVLYDELPPKILEQPADKLAYIDPDTLEIYYVDKSEEPIPMDPITALEEENALLALELAQTQLRLDQAEQEQAALLLELVSREVI